MNVLNATELHTEKWLKWYILCYIYFYADKSKAMYILIQGNKTNIHRTLNSHARECVMTCQGNDTTMETWSVPMDSTSPESLAQDPSPWFQE